MFRNLFFVLLLLSEHALLGQVVTNGRINLIKHDFGNTPTLNLDGLWHFYPSELVSSSAEIPSQKRMEVEVPKRWDQSDLPTNGFGTYELNVFKSADTPPLAINIPYIFSSYHVFVNGKLATSMGQPGINKDSTKPGWQVKLLPIGYVKSDTIQLLIQVANFDYSKGGIGKSIVLGTHEHLSKQKLKSDIANIFLTGCLVMGGFFFLGLYFFGRKEEMALFFALFCISYAYRIVGWGNYLIHDLVDIPFKLAVVLEYGSLYLCGYFFINYIKHLFPDEAPQGFIKIFSYFTLLWVALTLLPVRYVGQINVVFLLGLLIGVVLVCFVFVKAVINKRLGANYSIYSTTGILLVFGLRALDYMSIIEVSSSFAVTGQLIFFLFQSMILSKHFTESWREAKSAAEHATEAKSEFLSVMSHEIRTPLNAVIGTTQHLLDENPRKDQMKDLDVLKNSSENLLSLINNVLDFSKIDSGKVDFDISDVTLKEFCSNALNIFNSIIDKEKVELKFEYDDRLPDVVKFDKVRVNQVLGNLIGNAAKFTEKGEIKLEVIQLALTDKKVEVEFKIVDTGIGISNADQLVVFDSFRQANNSISKEYGGTGLGLFITNKLVRMMGSEVTLQSNLRTGSCFSFSLVLPIGKATNVELKPESEINFEGYNVLLVEDNKVNVLIAKRLLTKWKLEVVVAENGKIAIEKSQHNTFDLVLMDLRMPEMDGYEATKILRDLGFKMPILAVTASPQLKDSSKIAESGFDGFVLKPYIKEDLFKAISDKLQINH